MKKTAFLFAGQGAQYVGMGCELYENLPEARKVFEEASEGAGLDLYKLCKEGPEDQLNLTEYTQPAVVTVSLAALAAYRRLAETVVPVFAAGLSLGEYSALCAAGVFTVGTAAGLVRKRGRFMQEAVPEGVGAMAAVLGLKEELVKEACNMAEEAGEGYAAPANFNCPGQIAVGGEKGAVERVCQYAKDLGALKTVMLPVSAPFHTKMLEPAAERLAKELKEIELGGLSYPVISNLTAQPVSSSDGIKEILRRQVISPVLWEQGIRKMLEEGVERFIEFGPGRTLSSFVKKIDRKAEVFNIENLAGLEKAAAE